MTSADPAEQLRRDGRAWLRGAVPPAELAHLRELAGPATQPGNRIAPQDPLFRAMAGSGVSRRIAQSWPGARPVRLVAFNKGGAGRKGDASNWSLPWHQDRVIAVDERHDAPGCANWSRKAGQWHCEPPVETLRDMLFVRVHLDASTAENGAMEIAVGSHREGLVPGGRVDEVVTRCTVETTTAEPGDVLVLAMLTLHRSAPSVSRRPRRALRIDYAASDPPPPLAWAT